MGLWDLPGRILPQAHEGPTEVGLCTSVGPERVQSHFVPQASGVSQLLNMPPRHGTQVQGMSNYPSRRQVLAQGEDMHARTSICPPELKSNGRVIQRRAAGGQYVCLALRLRTRVLAQMPGPQTRDSRIQSNRPSTVSTPKKASSSLLVSPRAFISRWPRFLQPQPCRPQPVFL